VAVNSEKSTSIRQLFIFLKAVLGLGPFGRAPFKARIIP
jgi:hypothetical protein